MRVSEMGIGAESGKIFPVGCRARLCDACESAPAAIFCRADSAFLCGHCDEERTSARLGDRGGGELRVWMCEVCEQAPAAVTCKADAASLCAACDRDIHSANPLAGRHDRVPFVTAATKPFFADGNKPEDDQLDLVDDDSEEAEAASWIFPHSTSSTHHKFSDEPDMKPSDILFADSAVETFLDFDYAGFGATDSVVPAETGRALAPPNCFDIEIGIPKLSPYNSYTPTQSLSQSVSSDVGVVPEGVTSVSDASYTFVKPVTNGGGDSFCQAASSQATQLSGSEREARVMRYREKRKTRKFEKTIRYASRKAYAEMRPRIKGRFARRAEVDDTFYGGGPSAPATFGIMGDAAGYGVVPSF